MKMTFPFENDGNSIWYLSPGSRAVVFDLPTFGLQYHCFQTLTEPNEKYIKDLSYHGWHYLFNFLQVGTKVSWLSENLKLSKAVFSERKKSFRFDRIDSWGLGILNFLSQPNSMPVPVLHTSIDVFPCAKDEVKRPKELEAGARRALVRFRNWYDPPFQ